MASDDGDGSTNFHDYEGGGIGEGEGTKDVSDKIENEDQVMEAFRPSYTSSSLPKLCEMSKRRSVSVPQRSSWVSPQVEDTFQEGQEKEEQQQQENLKAEDNAIEMSEDFDGQTYDVDEDQAGSFM